MSVEAKGARKRVTAGVKGDPGLFFSLFEFFDLFISLRQTHLILKY